MRLLVTFSMQSIHSNTDSNAIEVLILILTVVGHLESPKQAVSIGIGSDILSLGRALVDVVLSALYAVPLYRPNSNTRLYMSLACWRPMTRAW